MKLNELNPKPSLQNIAGLDTDHLKPWEKSAILFAKSKGFTPIGSGAFANVFTSPVYPFVIKIFDYRDKGYIDWLKFCFANQNNPYVPKIRGKVLKVKETMRVLRMEHLGPFKSNNIELGALSDLIINYPTMWTSVAQTLRDEAFFKTLFKLLNHNYVEDTHLKDVCAYLHKLIKNGAILDFKTQNFLLRDNQIVFTDPIADSR